jgi:hypothetical protein
MAGEEVALGGVWVAGEDERVHAEGRVRLELGEHLVRVADEGGARAGAGPADAGPQVGLGVALVVGGRAQFALPRVSRGGGVQRPGADALAGVRVEPGD